jgi:hypothetical protein
MKESVAAQWIFFSAGGRQQRIAAQLLVVVDVFIAQGLTVNPLGQQLRHRVFDLDLIAVIAKAAGQPSCESERKIDLAQEQAAAVGREGAAGKIGNDFSATKVLKEQRLVLTVCCRRSGGWQFHLA